MTNKDITVKTSYGAASVRGTDFWSGQVNGQDGVLLVHNSRVEVRGDKCPEGTERDGSRCRCAVTLDQAEEGTYIDRRTGCPLLPRIWNAGEIDAALSTTNFSLAFAPSQVLPAALGLAGALTGFGVSTNQNNNETSSTNTIFPPTAPSSP
jgi:hypothetical protein